MKNLLMIALWRPCDEDLWRVEITIFNEMRQRRQLARPMRLKYLFGVVFALAFSLVATAAQAQRVDPCVAFDGLAHAHCVYRKIIARADVAVSEARQQEALHPLTEAERCMAAVPEFRGNCIQEMNDAFARSAAARRADPKSPQEIPIDGGACLACGAPKN